MVHLVNYFLRERCLWFVHGGYFIHQREACDRVTAHCTTAVSPSRDLLLGGHMTSPAYQVDWETINFFVLLLLTPKNSISISRSDLLSKSIWERERESTSVCVCVCVLPMKRTALVFFILTQHSNMPASYIRASVILRFPYTSMSTRPEEFWDTENDVIYSELFSQYTTSSRVALLEKRRLSLYFQRFWVDTVIVWIFNISASVRNALVDTSTFFELVTF